MSPAERSGALSSLEASANELDHAVSALQPAQWAFKPVERWSIAECVDHLAVVEERVLKALKTVDAPAASIAMTDAELLERLRDRGQPIAAPQRAYPTARSADPAATLAAFHQVRSHTIAFVTATNADLRAHAMPHPVFGPLDGYQWVITMAAHVRRHVQQIEEIKRLDGFPR